jgi:hypothetical protein
MLDTRLIVESVPGVAVSDLGGGPRGNSDHLRSPGGTSGGTVAGILSKENPAVVVV